MKTLELSAAAAPSPGSTLARTGAWLAPVVFVALWFAPLPLPTATGLAAALGVIVCVLLRLLCPLYGRT